MSSKIWWCLWCSSCAIAALGCGSKGSDRPGSGGAAGEAGGGPFAGSGGGSGGGDVEVDDDLPVELAEGLAPTPPMGWNSWNRFSCNVSATLIRRTADAMVASGMRDAGYTYINVDDCWAERERAEDGSVVVSPNFPEGIQPVADYVHELGLKLGIYSDRGTATCAGRAGSQDHEAVDAAAYAAWGVDYLKYDNCNATLDIEEQYRTMAQALEESGRPMVYSICAWQFYEWGVGLGHLWRTTGDITDTWDSITGNVALNRALAAYAGPNGWNDPDMLEVGNGTGDRDGDGRPDLGAPEYRAHFSLWAMMAAPLIAGNDLRSMTPEVVDILTKREIIAINQDPLGLQGTPVRTEGPLSVWAKPLNESGARAVLLFNDGEAPVEMAFTFEEIGLRAGSAAVRDLWAGQDRGEFTDRFSASVSPRDVVVLRVKGTEPARPVGETYVSDLTWTYVANGLGPVEKDTNVGATAAGDGAPLRLRGTAYEKGLGVAAPSAVIYRLARRCSTFSAVVGIDDVAEGAGSAVFEVWADGERLYQSPELTGEAPALPIEIDVTGRARMKLRVTNAGDGTGWDRADWADARLECDD